MSASEDLMFEHKIFITSPLRVVLSKTTLKPASDSETAPTVSIAISLSAGSQAVRKEKTFCRKAGYCSVTSTGLD